MRKRGSQRDETPSRLIDARIEELGDWRGEMLSQLRTLIKQADPEVVEEVKCRRPSNPAGVPVLYRYGIVCHGEARAHDRGAMYANATRFRGFRLWTRPGLRPTNLVDS